MREASRSRLLPVLDIPLQSLKLIARLSMLLFAPLMLCGTSASAQPKPSTLFINVNVVPMDQDRILYSQSVLVRDGRIAAIAPQVAAPQNARIINGHGTAFLLPGLADMHVHVTSEEVLAMLLASGVTTALDMGEATNAIVGRTRARVESGETPGPRLFVALAVDGSSRFAHLVVPTPVAARSTVQVAKANGYDFIKVYNGLSPQVFAEFAEEGPKNGLPIVGHTVESLGLVQQLNGGQSMVAHLEEFFNGFFQLPDGSGPQDAPDESQIARAVELLKRSGATVTADLITYQAIAEQWGRPEQVRTYLTRSESRFLSPGDRLQWRGSGYQHKSGSLAARADFLAHFVHALAESGVPLISGTDAPTVPGLVAGEALHRNLAALENAGLSRYQALTTATLQPGRFVTRVRPETENFGVVKEGARADLLLVPGNPLDDLEVLRDPLGVMAAGRWHDAEALAQLRAEVAETFATDP